MKKRMIALLIAAVLLLSMLCGCNKEKETTEDPGLQANLVVSCQADEAVLNVINEQIVKFQTIYPGVQVTLDATGQEAANIVCGTADQIAAYMKEDKLVNLESWIDDTSFTLDGEGNLRPMGISQAQKKDFVELFWEECKQLSDKGMYMLPLYRESQLIYYNGTYFEENEIESPYTWEDVELACQLILEKNPEAKPLVCRNLLSVFLSLCAEYGAQYTAEEGVTGLLATEGALKAAQLLNGWYQKGYLTTEELSLQDPGVYMVLDASSNLQKPEGTGDSYSFELKAMNLPYPAEADRKILTTGMNVAILRCEDEQILAAWLLVKSLCAEVDFQAELAMAGSVIPVLSSVEVNETYSAYLDNADGGENIGALVALTCMDQQHKLYAAPVYENSGEEKEKLEAFVVSCLESAEGVDALFEAGIE